MIRPWLIQHRLVEPSPFGTRQFLTHLPFRREGDVIFSRHTTAMTASTCTTSGLPPCRLQAIYGRRQTGRGLLGERDLSNCTRGWRRNGPFTGRTFQARDSAESMRSDQARADFFLAITFAAVFLRLFTTGAIIVAVGTALLSGFLPAGIWPFISTTAALPHSMAVARSF